MTPRAPTIHACYGVTNPRVMTRRHIMKALQGSNVCVVVTIARARIVTRVSTCMRPTTHTSRSDRHPPTTRLTYPEKTSTLLGSHSQSSGKGEGRYRSDSILPRYTAYVLSWLKQNVERLCRVFESARDGLLLRVKGKPVKINLKPDAHPQRCPQPKWRYGAKFNIMSKWVRKGLDCGIF